MQVLAKSPILRAPALLIIEIYMEIMLLGCANYMHYWTTTSKISATPFLDIGTSCQAFGKGRVLEIHVA